MIRQVSKIEAVADFSKDQKNVLDFQRILSDDSTGRDTHSREVGMLRNLAPSNKCLSLQADDATFTSKSTVI